MAPIELTKELERKARLFALVGDSTRIRILRLLAAKKSVNVSDIAQEVEMSVACVSHHLQLLKDNQIAEATRLGNNIYYQLAKDPFIKSLMGLVK